MRWLGILLVATYLSTIAQILPPNNAVAVSLGGASAAYNNVFSIENNVATLARCSSTVALNGSNRFGLSEYSNILLVGCYTQDQVSLGMAYKILPLAQFTEQKIQLAVARNLGEKVSVGLTLNYHSFTSIDAFYQDANVLTFNAGILYDVNEKLSVGFQAFNPNRSELAENPRESLASEYRMGIRYELDENINLYADAVQASDADLIAQAGIELEKDKYTIRGGFNLNSTIALGFGYQLNKLRLDVAASYHNQLGFSPSLNLVYAF